MLKKSGVRGKCITRLFAAKEKLKTDFGLLIDFTFTERQYFCLQSKYRACLRALANLRDARLQGLHPARRPVALRDG
jgi:hypothetical protein